MLGPDYFRLRVGSSLDYVFYQMKNELKLQSV